MKDFILHRIVDNRYGMFGVLYCGEDFMCTTLERSWKDNAPSISCIPAGTYVCRRGTWPKHGETFEVTGVKDRSAILFHKGNYQNDSMGCILLGSGYANAVGQLIVSASGDAYAAFHRYLKDENEFNLTIKAAA